MKTAKEIAQWVIDNRYPKSENEKVSDIEMYHQLVQIINELCNVVNCKVQTKPIKFNRGDEVICWADGIGYGDKFTVVDDTMGLTLICQKSGSLCIVNNRQDYELYQPKNK